MKGLTGGQLGCFSEQSALLQYVCQDVAGAGSALRSQERGEGFRGVVVQCLGFRVQGSGFRGLGVQVCAKALLKNSNKDTGWGRGFRAEVGGLGFVHRAHRLRMGQT